MEVHYRLTQGQLSEIIAAALSYNGKHPIEVLWNPQTSINEKTGELSVTNIEAVVVCEDEPIKVRVSPDDDAGTIDPMSEGVLKNFRKSRESGENV